MDSALNFKTLARRTLLLLALAAPSVIPLPVVTTPSEFIPLGRTEKYSCVSDGSFVEWLVSVPGMALLALRPDDGNTMINSIMRGYGIAMDRNFPFVLLVNASSLNNGTVLQCTSIVSEVATLSSSVAIYVFGPPDIPSALGVIPLGADTLELSWKPPFSPPGVNTSYTVLVSDLSAPSKEPALTVGPILEPRFTYHAPKQSSLCSQRYEFRVMAGNDAGEGYPSTPLITSAPAVPQLGILRSEVLSIAENNIAINLLFFTARACENFPVEGYYIKVVNELTNDSAVKQIAQYTTSTNGSYFEVKLRSPSDGLQPNMRYTCSVWAYNAVGRSSPSSIVVYTTDVQSSTITGSDHQLNVTCFFAEGTITKGCVVCLEKSGEVVYQMIPRVNGTAKGMIRTEFSVDCYNISVMDWEEDGSIGSLGVPIHISFSLSLPISNCNGTIPAGSLSSKILPSTFVGVVGGVILFIVAAVGISMITKERKRLIFHRKKFNLQQPNFMKKDYTFGGYWCEVCIRLCDVMDTDTALRWAWSALPHPTAEIPGMASGLLCGHRPQLCACEVCQMKAQSAFITQPTSEHFSFVQFAHHVRLPRMRLDVFPSKYVPDVVIGIVTPWTSMLTGFSIISGDPTRDCTGG
ncbi:hypothetical protein EMCRGX_G012072 [Ephydatia muelleri]